MRGNPTVMLILIAGIGIAVIWLMFGALLVGLFVGVFIPAILVLVGLLILLGYIPVPDYRVRIIAGIALIFIAFVVWKYVAGGW